MYNGPMSPEPIVNGVVRDKDYKSPYSFTVNSARKAKVPPKEQPSPVDDVNMNSMTTIPVKSRQNSVRMRTSRSSDLSRVK